MCIPVSYTCYIVPLECAIALSLHFKMEFRILFSRRNLHVAALADLHNFFFSTYCGFCVLSLNFKKGFDNLIGWIILEIV